MKFIKVLFLAFLLTFPVLNAQDEDLEDMDFEEVPIVEERPTYFAIGAGYTGTLAWINLDDINAKITNDFFLPEYSGSLYLSGAHGFTGIGIIPNIRLGFFGVTGKQKVSQNQDTIQYGSTLSLNYTGFSIDYGFVLFDHFAILPGIQVGWSSLNLNVYRTLNTATSPDWTEIEPEYNPEYFSKDVKGAFWFIQPQLYFEYALTPFLMARASAGYNLSFNTSWEYNSSADLKNVPDKITTGGFSAQFGIFVGLFNF